MFLLAVIAAVLLYAVWILLSGFFTPFLLTAGALTAIAVTAWAWRMGFFADEEREGYPIHLTGRALAYGPWLLWEIVKSAWSVTKTVLAPRLSISPTVAVVPAGQRTMTGIVTYANSITLTPGTISIEVEPGGILVHALQRAGITDLEDGGMDRRVQQFEGTAR